MAEVRRTRLAEQAAQLLMQRIQAGEWALGARLPGETTLAPQLGVGRSTVREAIRQLAGRGVLQSRQGAGVFLVALDAPEPLGEFLRRSDIVAVIEARTAIETEAAALAARRRTPADLRALRRALEHREQSSEDIETLVGVDGVFHRLVVAAAHNEVLLELFDAFVPRVRIAMVGMLRLHPEPDPAADQATHQGLVDAIAQRDPTEAADRARRHLDALRTRLS